MRGPRAIVAGAIAAGIGCNGASPDPGLQAVLQVEGAQFRPGGFPADEGGPAATALTTQFPSLIVGELGLELRGALEPAARSVVAGRAW